MLSKTKKNSSDQTLGDPIQKQLREGCFIFVLALAIYCFLSLLTYTKQDPGWSHAVMVKHIHNSGGRAGAWFADMFLYLFGLMAYAFPSGMAYLAWVNARISHSRQKEDYRLWVLKLFGFLFVLASGCGLLSLHHVVNAKMMPVSLGGVLGSVLATGLTKSFNVMGSSLLLLALALSGITLLTGLSWIRLMDNCGEWALSFSSHVVRFWQFVQEWWRARAARRKAEILKSNVATTAKVSKRQMPILHSPAGIDPPVFEPPQLPDIPKLKNESKVIARPEKTTHQRVAGLPSITLLDEPDKIVNQSYSNALLEQLSREVEARLNDFGVNAQVVAVHPGPVITRFELQLAPGIKVSKISTLSKDLARSMSVVSVRVVEVIPGKSVIGLELPNESRQIVRLSEVIASRQYEQSRSAISLALGKDIAGHPVVVDLGKMPHLLVAGTTGSGKSVGVNAMLLSMLYKSRPDQVRLILIDPKMLELSIYDGIPHLLTPVVTDMKEAANALRWCVAEMDRRYRLMAALGVRNLNNYNAKVKEAEAKGSPLRDPLWQPTVDAEPELLTTLPCIVVVIDEFADMMMVVGKKVEELIARLAQKARAAGIHLILATQRPSVDVITGLIKANIPTRIAFQVSSKIDSRTILDQQGAEQLLGHGDMLYLAPGTGIPVRIHGAFVSDQEVHSVVNDLKQHGEPVFIDEITADSQGDGSNPLLSLNDGEADELYDKAVEIVISSRRATISSLQRRLKIGYNRAARMIEQMEEAGVVSQMETNGNREVLVPEQG